jgi:probable F420-dependent oxidoreductase
VKIDLPLSVTGGALADVAEVARAAEDAGFDGVSYSETTSDPILHLTVAAGATRRVELMTNIVVAFARSPMTLAVQGRALQDYSGGRLVLGLGSQIKPHIERRFSMPWSAPAARMAEYVRAMRAIWHAWETGEPLRFEGEFYTHTLMTPMFSPPSTQPAPKVFLAAVGDRMTQTAGAVADGMLIHPFSTEAYFRDVTLPALTSSRAGSELAGQPLEVVSSAFVVTGRDDAELAASATAVRNQIAFYGSTPAYLPVLEHHGWGALGLELNRLSKTSDPDRWAAMGRLVDDDVLQAFALIAEPDRVGAALRARWGGLVDRYEVNPVGVRDAELQRAVAAGMRATIAEDVTT